MYYPIIRFLICLFETLMAKTTDLILQDMYITYLPQTDIYCIFDRFILLSDCAFLCYVCQLTLF